jgi:hypothetical protein
VGFLTFPFDFESAAATAIEGKVKMLSRAVVGSPPAAGQAILLAGLSGIGLNSASETSRPERRIE